MQISNYKHCIIILFSVMPYSIMQRCTMVRSRQARLLAVFPLRRIVSPLRRICNPTLLNIRICNPKKKTVVGAIDIVLEIIPH